MAQAERERYSALWQTQWCGGPVMVDGHYLPCVLVKGHNVVLVKGHNVDCEHDERDLRAHLARGADECRRCACLTRAGMSTDGEGRQS